MPRQASSSTLCRTSVKWQRKASATRCLRRCRRRSSRFSIGIGSMEIFGSYLDRKKRITGEAVNIVLLDTFVALMAAFTTFRVLCLRGGAGPGPSLKLITLPTLFFNNMAGGRIWGTLFFIFHVVCSTFDHHCGVRGDSRILHGYRRLSRKKAVGVNFVLITVLSLPAILGFTLSVSVAARAATLWIWKTSCFFHPAAAGQPCVRTRSACAKTVGASLRISRKQ